MIKTLSITNYALIDELEINFNEGLSTITGETGAGKSIILSALSLLLGNRFDANAIGNPDKKCIVEASFLVSETLRPKFEELDLDFEQTCIIRRQLSNNGKSRAFINDNPVTLTDLKAIGAFLIDIHSQHETLELNNNYFQLNILDSFSQTKQDLISYSDLFDNWNKLNNEYTRKKNSAAKSKEEYDFIQHQYLELKNAEIKEDEQELLETELKKLEHSEDIIQSFSSINTIFQEEEIGIQTKINEIKHLLSKIARYDKEYENLYARIESIGIELNDISQEIVNCSDKIELDPDRSNFVSTRLNTLYTLQQKHKASDVNQLLSVCKTFENKINEIEHYDFDIENLHQQKEKAYNEALHVAQFISTKRKNAIPEMENLLNELLKSLGISDANFKIAISSSETLNENGIDEINFLFSANKQFKPQEISKIASGGELSRLMLCLKSLLAGASNLPTIIFDEIDTGVSGDVADKMGKLIREMADKMQIINITHLPQIASKGQFHFKVYKNSNENANFTKIKKLTIEERIVEIAQMLSGEVVSAEAISNAKTLLGI